MHERAVAALVPAIAQRGYAVARDALEPTVVEGLRSRAGELDRTGAFAPALVGRGESRLAQIGIRGDRIAWLGTAQSPAEAALGAWLEALRMACNRDLFLGLEEFEGHYAIYPPGARYARHRDRFRDDDARVLSCVLYLNEAWRASDGGALRLYTSAEDSVDVLPQGGTFVAFLAAEFDHEVLAASRERVAFAGWYRRRPLAAPC